jgi:hypothetical protein
MDKKRTGGTSGLPQLSRGIDTSGPERNAGESASRDRSTFSDGWGRPSWSIHRHPSPAPTWSCSDCPDGMLTKINIGPPLMVFFLQPISSAV